MRRSARRQRLVRVVVTLAVLLIPSAAAGLDSVPGRAAPAMGGEVRISGNPATSYENRPDAAWNSSTGQYLVVWSDGRSDATGRGEDIYARLVGADGKPIGAEKVISGAAALGDDQCPAVAWGSTTGQYLVVWQDGRDPSKGAEIYGRLVGPDGKPNGADFRISDSSSDEVCGDVAWGSSTNQFLVVWEDYRSYGRGADVFGRLVASSGKPVGTADFLISGPGATCDDYTPAVAWGATAQQYLVVWTDYRNNAARGADVYGARVTAAGAAVGGDFLISGTGAVASDYRPAVAWGAALNQFLVVWEDWRRPPGRGTEIYGQRVKANGTLAGGERRISGTNATADEMAPDVAWSAGPGQFLVVWQDWRNYYVPRYADIFGRQVRDDGVPIGNDFRVCGPKALMNDYDPAVAWNALSSQFLVVWTDARSYSGRSFDIYGRPVAG